MVPLPIQYNNIPNGQWMSPQFVPLTTFPPQLSPVDHHALASQMGQLHLGGAGYIGTPPYTPYSTPQAVSTNSIASEVRNLLLWQLYLHLLTAWFRGFRFLFALLRCIMILGEFNLHYFQNHNTNDAHHPNYTIYDARSVDKLYSSCKRWK